MYFKHVKFNAYEYMKNMQAVFSKSISDNNKTFDVKIRFSLLNLHRKDNTVETVTETHRIYAIYVICMPNKLFIDIKLSGISFLLKCVAINSL